MARSPANESTAGTDAARDAEIPVNAKSANPVNIVRFIFFSFCNFPLNPNRSSDTPCPFLIGKMRLPGILPAFVRILSRYAST